MCEATFKILLISGIGVDKSGLIPRFLTNLPRPDSEMQIGLEFKAKDLVVDNKKYKLQVWDYLGEERFRFLLPTFFRGANGAIFIYDITKETSVVELQNWINKIKDQIKLEVHATFPIIVLGNKPILGDKNHIYQQERFASENLVGVNQFIECSIRTGENVEKAFETITRLILADNEYNLKKTKRWDEVFSKNDFKSKDRKEMPKKKIEERLNVYEENIERMISLILRIPDFVDQSLAIVNKKISTLESRFKTINNELSAIRTKSEGQLGSSVGFFPPPPKTPSKLPPPPPPEDSAMAPQAQVQCQYCGMKLTKEEQFTHSCNRFFFG